MKKGTMKACAAIGAVLGLLASAPRANAATDIIMDYAGGTLLESSNVQEINLDDYEKLTIAGENARISVSGAKWSGTAFVKQASGCREVKYFKIGNSSDSVALGTDANLTATITNGSETGDRFKIVANFGRVQANRAAASDETYIVAIDQRRSVYIGYNIYETLDKCTNGTNPIGTKLNDVADQNLFVEMQVKLYKGSNSTPFVAKGVNGEGELYFALQDIDARQSYMILNSGNELSRDTMYTVDPSRLQPEGAGGNYYVSGAKKYIYSTYADVDGPNIYVRLLPDTQASEKGLDIVLGQETAATTTLAYYTKQYKVFYVSDENGEISSGELAEEDRYSGENPTSSATTPKDRYVLAYWTADVDVILEDGSIIPAGTHLTSEGIKQVVVNQNITFTAHHETKTPSAPNTGSMTSEKSSAHSLGIALPLAFVAVIVSSLYIFNRRRL